MRGRLMLSMSLGVLAGLSLALESSAFITTCQFAGRSHRRSATCVQGEGIRSGAGLEAAGALLSTLRARQGVLRGSPTASIGTERTEVSVVKSDDQWHELMAAAAESGSTLVVLFKKDFCRKCAAMKPKFAKLANAYYGRGVIWAEVDGIKLGRELRSELKLVKVPSFQVWGQGRVLEHFDADMDLAKTVSLINVMVEKHSGGAGAVPPESLLLRDLNSRVSKEISKQALSSVV